MDISDPFLLLIIVSYVLVCPYTKVEESFNMQATFDLLHFGPGGLATFDHLEFPGVVPRTFIGSLVLASLSYPLHYLVQLLRMDPVVDQIATRCVLSCISWMSFLHFKDGVARKFGRRTAQLTLLLTCLQFHTCFYMSRTLPNVFAMILSLNAFAFWLKGGPLLSLVLLTATTVVFRCDMLVFLAPYVLQLLVCREVTFKQTAACGLLTGAMSLLLTVAIDSYFWRQWVWPEGVVLFFNTVQNKSSEWGTMPFHWYFSNALLKIFNVSLLWVACGLLGVSFPSKSLAEDASAVTVWGRLNFIGSDMFLRGLDYRSLYYAMPALHFITLYSLLPHKELRFILPAVPLLTMTGAVGLDRMLPMDCSRLWYPFNLLQTLHRRVGSEGKRRDNNDNDSHAYGAYNHAISCVLWSTFLVMALVCSTLLSASHHNYPGGQAMERLLGQHLPVHLVERKDRLPSSQSFRPMFVHIDASAAMTGITRFIQRRVMWGSSSDRHRGQRVDALRNYLNLRPEQYDRTLNQCLWGAEKCAEEADLIYYSKEEGAADLSGYDWLITGDPSSALASGDFHVVESVKGFHHVGLSWTGPYIELKPMLYIMVNTRPD